MSSGCQAPDRDAVRQSMARFLRALDTGSWEDCRRLLCGDAQIELAARADGADAWVAAASRALSDSVSVHHAHMPEVELTGPGQALSGGALLSYVERASAGARDGRREYGRYDAQHRFEDGSWRIAGLRAASSRCEPLDGERPRDIDALRLGRAMPQGPPARADPAALVELEAIARLKARYFRLLDTRRWREWRGLFTDDARFELKGVAGDVSDADRFVATVRRGLRGTVTVHHGHMPALELVDEQRARGVWSLNDYVDWCAGSSGIRGFGNYEEEYEKAGGEWRIASLRLSYLRLDGFSRAPWTPVPLRRPMRDWLAGGAGAGIERLDDLDQIRGLKARYFRLMDAKQWAAMRELFTADARFSTPRMGRATEGLDAFMATLERQLEGVATVHHGHMPEIAFTGADEARGIWALFDRLEWPPGAGGLRAYAGYGHYEEGYRRTDDGWRIASLRLSRLREDVTR